MQSFEDETTSASFIALVTLASAYLELLPLAVFHTV